MTDAIGRGVLLIEADATDVSSGMAQATQAVSKFEREAVDAANKVGASMTRAGKETTIAAGQIDSATKRLIQQIEREAIMAEKGRAGWLEYRAAQIGASDAAAPFLARLRATQGQMGGLAMSARQTTAAMRMLPMQMTDVVTSLASGAPVWMVAIQQGGQIKDSFGGIVPAARALTSVFTPLRLAMGGVAGVAAGLALAYKQGSEEADAYTRAIVMTGNVAGVTAGQLAVMADNVSRVTGTHSEAAAALAAFVGAGDVATGSLERFTATALELEKRGGVAIEETVQAFAKLGREPLKASIELNERYRYLTVSIYDQIKALEEQGRKAEAAALAQSAYADAMDTRMSKLRENLGYLEGAWETIATTAKKAWDAMLGIGREQSVSEALKTAKEVLAGMESGNAPWGMGFTQAQIDQQRELVRQLQARADTVEGLAAAEGEWNRRQQAGINARTARSSSSRGRGGPRASERVDMTIEQQSIVAAHELIRRAEEGAQKYALTLRTLDQMFFGGTINVEQYDRAVAELTRTTEKAGRDGEEALRRQAEAWLDMIDPTREYRRELAAVDAAMRGGFLGPQQAAAIKAHLETQQRARQVVDETTEYTLQAARNIQSALGDQLYDVLQGKFDNIGDRFKQVLDRMVAEAAAANLAKYLLGDFAKTGNLGGALGGFLGGLFGGGGGAMPTPVAASAANPFGMSFHAAGDVFGPGGILSAPMAFSYGTNRAGVAGEAGYEAVMPVARGPDGRLGVQASSSAAPAVTNHVTMHIATPDAESFRRSEGQIASRLSGALSRGARVR